jgi:hypothetical protein
MPAIQQNANDVMHADNPYDPPQTRHGERRPVRQAGVIRTLIGILLCSIAPAWLLLLVIEQQLLEAGVLNTKDMPPIVGKEKGSLSEFLLNVWHWDGMLLLLFVCALPCFLIGVLLIRSSRSLRQSGNAV